MNEVVVGLPQEGNRLARRQVDGSDVIADAVDDLHSGMDIVVCEDECSRDNRDPGEEQQSGDRDTYSAVSPAGQSHGTTTRASALRHLSICAIVISGKKGSERTERDKASQPGNEPSFWPRNRHAGCRWIGTG